MRTVFATIRILRCIESLTGGARGASYEFAVLCLEQYDLKLEAVLTLRI